MSDNIFEAERLYVTRYVGPDKPGDRRRWQFTIAALHPESPYTSLDTDQAAALGFVLLRSVYGQDVEIAGLPHA